MNKTFTKVLAGSAAAMLLLPTLALAHGGENWEKSKNWGKNSLQVRIENRLDKAEHRDDRPIKNATTTAASITKKGVRIQAAVDTMLSFNGRVSALIASSSAETMAALQAKFSQFQTAATNAKVEAGAAITGAAQVNATNSTTTNASLIATAKADLREARNFLQDAKEAFFSILRSFFN